MAKISTDYSRIDVGELFSINDYGTRSGEAEEIADLYRRTYQVMAEDVLTQTAYPYPEAFDPEWIHATASDQFVVWKVVRDNLTDTVVGTGTVLLNPTDERGYVRGVMIDRAYQGQRLSSYFLVNAYREVIQKYRDIIKIFYTENRTAHTKSQRISESSGMRPVALLPYKDIFLRKRESDVLYILYSMNTLKSRRSDVSIIPEIVPIFNLMTQQFRLEAVQPTQIPRVQGNGYDVKAHISVEKYNYHKCTYRANNQQLEFTINPRTQTAENMVLSSITDPIALKTILRFALLSLRKNLFYMEAYVSAYQPEFQQVFSDLGFHSTGYLPAWNKFNRKREDVIIFSWVKEYPLLKNLQLTRRANKIAKIFLS